MLVDAFYRSSYPGGGGKVVHSPQVERKEQREAREKPSSNIGSSSKSTLHFPTPTREVELPSGSSSRLVVTGGEGEATIERGFSKLMSELEGEIETDSYSYYTDENR